MVSNCFDIGTAEDFYNKIAKPQYQDFLDNNSSARYALLSILVAHHLHEWVGDKIEFGKGKKYQTFQKAFLARYPDFETEADYFEMARMICNDTKHFLGRVVTRNQFGFSSFFSPFFARPLMINMGDGNEVSADCFLKCLFDFWEKQIVTHTS